MEIVPRLIVSILLITPTRSLNMYRLHPSVVVTHRNQLRITNFVKSSVILFWAPRYIEPTLSNYENCRADFNKRNWRIFFASISRPLIPKLKYWVIEGLIRLFRSFPAGLGVLRILWGVRETMAAKRVNTSLSIPAFSFQVHPPPPFIVLH